MSTDRIADRRVVAIAEIFGIGGRRDELLDLFVRTQQQVREVPGSRRYVFAARLEMPDEFVLVSEWDTYDAMAAYHRSEQFARYQFELGGLLARPSEMTIYSVTDTVRPVSSGPPDPRDAD
jgi:quinol monooxygenase YgiN